MLKAKAEGIVEGTPGRNIVAVKTIKGIETRSLLAVCPVNRMWFKLLLDCTENATLEDTENLWDELFLMKHMEPHENILNLLGHCTKGMCSCIQ